MIFLAVGTWRRGFDRLVRAVDELVSRNVITEEVIAQIGYGSYKPSYIKALNFCSPEEFVNLISKSNFVISHAGIGTIILAAENAKPIIVVPRKSSLGEADNDDQDKVARQLEIEGKILVAHELPNLPAKLEQVKTFVPVKSNSAERIVTAIGEFLNSVAEEKEANRIRKQRRTASGLWPYRILRRDDDDIKADLNNIVQHFAKKGSIFDEIVFIPDAGYYLGELFEELHNGSFDVKFALVRRATSVTKNNFAKEFIFKRKWLSTILRHFEVFLRLIKFKFGIRQKMVAEFEIDFDVTNKKILVIDDSVDTGITIKLVKSALLDKGAQSVTTACISNMLLPNRVDVDYAVYRYRLLRTKKSRDYSAN